VPISAGHAPGEAEVAAEMGIALEDYPLLLGAFETAVPSNVKVLDPSPWIADRLVDWLRRHPSYASVGSGSIRVLCTGDPDVFRQAGEIFAGHPLGAVQHVTEDRGRLAPRESMRVRVGQVVR